MYMSFAHIPSSLKDDDKISIKGYGDDLMAGRDDFAKIVRALICKSEKVATPTAAVCKKYLTWLDDKVGNHNGISDTADFARLCRNIGDYISDELTICEEGFASEMKAWSERLKPFKKELTDFLRATDVYKAVRSDKLDEALENYEAMPGFDGEKEIYRYFGDPLDLLDATDSATYLKITDKITNFCKEVIDITNRIDERGKQIKSMIEFNTAFNTSLTSRDHNSGSSIEPLLEKYFAAQNYLLLTPLGNMSS